MAGAAAVVVLSMMRLSGRGGGRRRPIGPRVVHVQELAVQRVQRGLRGQRGGAFRVQPFRHGFDGDHVVRRVVERVPDAVGTVLLHGVQVADAVAAKQGGQAVRRYLGGGTGAHQQPGAAGFGTAAG
ncbi:hypothetical protein G6F31_019232 [Rhizopus arrhizus]|nr:hypothetical protein G6F31_019232 [Rhizopus arrhizus]